MNSTATTSTERPYWIEWDMGTYGPFNGWQEARDFQRDNHMTGSSVTDIAPEEN